MSFQAYLDKVEEITGKAPEEFVAEAKKKNLTSHKEIVEWLKTDYGLGTGHARAITHGILHGSEFTVKQTTGAHRDMSGSLNLGGKEVTEKKATK